MSDKMKNIRLRILILGLGLGLLLCIIGLRAAYLQVYRDDWLSDRAQGEYKKFFRAKGKRGIIYDRRHRKLAVTDDITSITANPKTIENSDKALAILAKLLKLNKKKLKQKLSSKKSFVWIKRKVDPTDVYAVKKEDLKGIDFIPEYKRFYPHKSSAAQVIGFCGLDGRGLEGLEFYYDRYLLGKDKTVTVLKDALGRGFDGKAGASIESRGSNLILTIDLAIQNIVEKSIEEAVVKFSAKSAMAIVMDPQTGAVLALAHFPGFNPNSFKKSKRESWRNRALTDPFEPGSIMKIFSAAAAIESGRYKADDIFFCENGAYKIGKNVVHDTKKHGWLSLQQIIKYSSNIGIAKLSHKMGSDLLYKTLLDFGFAKKTMIDCPGESTGKLSHYSKWTDIDAGTIAFGHGISASIIQIATGVCAIANKGVLIKPYIVQAITDPNGRLIKSFSPKIVRRVISERTADTVSWIMHTVTTQGGTGINASLDGYLSCGKTGTSQKLDPDGQYVKGKYIASFVGFAPMGTPKVVILVVVDEPSYKYYGGSVAAPAFKKIAQETLIYMDVPPQIDSASRFLQGLEVIDNIQHWSSPGDNL